MSLMRSSVTQFSEFQQQQSFSLIINDTQFRKGGRTGTDRCLLKMNTLNILSTGTSILCSASSSLGTYCSEHLLNFWRKGLKYYFLSKCKQFKVPQCPEAARALSQHQNEPRGQSALGLLAPRNLAAWLAKPSDLASLGREGTPDNYQNPKTAQTLQQGYKPLCTLTHTHKKKNEQTKDKRPVIINT